MGSHQHDFDVTLRDISILSILKGMPWASSFFVLFIKVGCPVMGDGEGVEVDCVKIKLKWQNCLVDTK